MRMGKPCVVRPTATATDTTDTTALVVVCSPPVPLLCPALLYWCQLSPRYRVRDHLYQADIHIQSR